MSTAVSHAVSGCLEGRLPWVKGARADLTDGGLAVGGAGEPWSPPREQSDNKMLSVCGNQSVATNNHPWA